MTRAIVVGASVAGLVAARVLADAVDEVIVLDRDEVPAGAVPRPGIPQAAHVHVLLHRGHRELGRLFPGFDARLASKGAVPVDWARDAIWVTPHGEGPRFASTLTSRSASRSLVDAALLDGIARLPNVQVVGGTEVVGLLGGASGVTGVSTRRRGTGSPPAGLDAWLVVDASGRSSRVDDHLASIGLAPPDETVVDASLRYATRLVRLPDQARDWVAVIVHDRPPGATRGGAIVRIEAGRWLVTLGGAGEADHPPLDDAGFLDFARSLISPRVHDALVGAEPLTPIRGWARTANRWRHAERMVDWPRGLAIAGDALCALNPVYGQGMSVAAMEGPVLARWLRSRPVRESLRAGRPADTRPLLRALAATARLPWFLAVSEDSRMPGVIGAPHVHAATAFARRYFEAVLRTAPRDAATFRRLSQVTQLVRSPMALFDPVVMWRVARSRGGASH